MSDLPGQPNPPIRKRGKMAPERITLDNLPDPECILGYPREQAEALLGASLARFNWWMRGQTVALCDGKRYNYDTKKTEPSGCGPHGTVIYVADIRRWFANEGVMG